MARFIVLFASLFLSFSVGAFENNLGHIQQVQSSGTQYLSYYFGDVWLNSSRSITYTVTNYGESALTFQSAHITGASYYAYHTCGGIIPAKGQCEFRVEFRPLMEGTWHGRFELHFVENSSIEVSFSGNGIR